MVPETLDNTKYKIKIFFNGNVSRDPLQLTGLTYVDAHNVAKRTIKRGYLFTDNKYFPISNIDFIQVEKHESQNKTKAGA